MDKVDKKYWRECNKESKMDKQKIITCKEYVQIRKEKLKDEVSSFLRKPRLCVIQIGDDAASNSYIKGKIQDCEDVGVEFEHKHFKDYKKLTQENIITFINNINACETIDGIIIQLPIPNKYDINELQKYISPEKDVDGFRVDSYFQPCTPKGIMDWLDYNNYSLVGKNITVLGRSKIVGKPLVNMLIDKGATVTCCNSKTKNLNIHTSNADVIISAIGRPKFLSSSHFTNPDIIIDVGINRDENNKLCGDVNREDIETHCINTYVTPVPGSVGLLTRLVLLENTIEAYRNKL